MHEKNVFSTDSFGLLLAVISCATASIYILRSLVDQGHTIKAESIRVRIHIRAPVPADFIST